MRHSLLAAVFPLIGTLASPTLAAANEPGAQGSTTPAPSAGQEGKPARPPQGARGKLVFGLYPSDSPTEMYRQFLPLCEYLTATTGYQVDLDVSPSYAAGIEKIRKGEVDLFRSGAGAFGHLLLEEKSRAPVLVVVEQEGEKKETTFRGAIVTRQDAPFRTIQDLAGKTFAFGDRRSTMANQVPRKMLATAGVRLASSVHLKSHDDVALAVLNGEFDAGACKAPTAEKYKEKGLRILVLTEPSPSKPIYARYGLEEAKIEAVRKALLALDASRPDHRTILAGIEAKLSGYGAGKDPVEYEQFARFLGSETEDPAPAAPPGQ